MFHKFQATVLLSCQYPASLSSLPQGVLGVYGKELDFRSSGSRRLHSVISIVFNQKNPLEREEPMKSRVILSAFVLVAALGQAASSSAGKSHRVLNPSFVATKWKITPLKNGLGERSSTVKFEANGLGQASFDKNPSKTYNVQWKQDNPHGYIMWWMADSEGTGVSRAFRSKWTTPYNGGQATFVHSAGYSCVVTPPYVATFTCQSGFNTYNFNQKFGVGK